MSEKKSKESVYKLKRRPRRLRKTAAVRSLVQETHLRQTDFIQPLFVIDGTGEPEAVESMPGVKRYPLDSLLAQCEVVLKSGVLGVALFPSLDAYLKSADGAEALNRNSLILRTVAAIKKRFPELVLIADIALDPYTSHGHDGVLTADGSDVDNDATLDILVKMAVLHAEVGVDFVAPSDMMDGHVAAIRSALDTENYINTGILAYASKFASAYYGPFRDAVGSVQATPISKVTYQLNPANSRKAILEAMLDEEEGADILMVKPAGPYLDIIAAVRETTVLPVAAYQVSGEYAQIHAASRAGWLDYEKTRDESLLAIKRAGADIILSYFASEVAAGL